MRSACRQGGLLPAFFASALLALTSAQATFAEEAIDPAAAKKACDKGSVTDCHALAQLFREGLGVPKDLGKSAGLLKKACEKQHAQSCFELAQQHWTGEGVSKDIPKAAELMQKACDGGYAESCGKLGKALHD